MVTSAPAGAAPAPDDPAPALPPLGPGGPPSAAPIADEPDPMLVRAGEFELDPRIPQSLKAGTSENLVLRPFVDVAIPFDAANSMPFGPTHVAWRGRVRGDPAASLWILVHQPRGRDPDFRRIVIGVRSRRHGSFEIRAREGTTRLLAEEVDYRRRPPCGVVEVPDPLRRTERERCSVLPSPLATTPTVEVLVAYTQLLAGTPAQDTILKDDLLFALLLAQAAMTDSGVPIVLNMAAGEAQEVTDPWNEWGTMREICQDLKFTRNNRFRTVRTMRTDTCADLVCLIVKKGRDANQHHGWAFVPPCLLENDMRAGDLAFSVCSRSHIGEALAHELAHNFGCHHHCGGAACRDPVPYYRHGNLFPSTLDYGTVMAESGYRVLQFSTSDAAYGYLHPNGTTYTTGDVTYRDNARILRETAGTVETFRCP